MQLTGGAARRLQLLMPAGRQAVLLLTMTDEPPYAFAQIVIQASR